MYVAELNALHIGGKIGMMKKYRYAGEDRVKARMFTIEMIQHSKKNTKFYGFELTEAGNHKGFYRDWFTFPFDQECVVSYPTT